ncbi:DUF4864 domain-containing protein [Kaistia defluvii]|uniref:DUF4864 domain-containing protein n=1 Tax=Kaistia defluvii TaxID=410841 RepID=UPI002252C78F|nr:DUF4864 domain-containing protein [Kaistia defluvii]MCX5521066.1 DUF4864 domain-containing protein [Kaistia defluvii]
MTRIAFAIVFLMATSLLSTAAVAAEPTSSEQSLLKQLVQDQLAAFQRDDGAAAYDLAAPGIRKMFPSPDIFIGMVKQAYPPIYRPQSLAYGKVTDSPIGLVQKVYVTGPDGRNWVALYRFEKQPDGTWKIAGCSLVKDTEPTI